MARGVTAVVLALISVESFALGKALPKNESNVRVVGSSKIKVFHGEDGKNMISRCQGATTELYGLSKVGLTKEDLKNGVDCLAYDFDGNGYLDFMLFGKRPKGKVQSGLVLFFNKEFAVRWQVIEGVESLVPLIKIDPEEENYSKYRGSFGLIYHFGGDYGAVFFYDKGLSIFKKVPYVPYGRTKGDLD